MWPKTPTTEPIVSNVAQGLMQTETLLISRVFQGLRGYLPGTGPNLSWACAGFGHSWPAELILCCTSFSSNVTSSERYSLATLSKSSAIPCILYHVTLLFHSVITLLSASLCLKSIQALPVLLTAVSLAPSTQLAFTVFWLISKQSSNYTYKLFF